MTARTFHVLLVLALLVVIAGCPRRVSSADCEGPRDCDLGEVCEEGACVPAPVGGVSCATDADCNVVGGELCNPQTLVCEGGTGAGGVAGGGSTGGGSGGGGGGATGACTNTADCPIDQFCNTSTGLCAALAAGFCREASQCTSSEAPICSASSPSVPGRCVECLSRSDCGGAECVNPGVCSDMQCPANSTPIGGQCRCNTGYEQKPDGSCVAVSTSGGGTGGGGTGGGTGGGGTGGGGSGGGAGGTCDPQLLGLDCVGTGPYNWCDAGQCVCDALFLEFTCLFDGSTSDASTCGCTGTAGGDEGGGAEPTAPDGWLCQAGFYGSADGCDCGCGVADPDCNAGGCTELGCRESVCEYCYDSADAAAAGDAASCNATAPPPAWQCPVRFFGSDDGCDCGCGELDPDCGGGGCSEAGCIEDACAYCYASDEASAEPYSIDCGADTTGGGTGGGGTGGGSGSGAPAPSSWICDTMFYADGICDCGCGAVDDDCGTGGCSESGCSEAQCVFCYDDFFYEC